MKQYQIANQIIPTLSEGRGWLSAADIVFLITYRRRRRDAMLVVLFEIARLVETGVVEFGALGQDPHCDRFYRLR